MSSVIQLLAGGRRGNAVVNEALAFEAALHKWGYQSAIYSPELHPSLHGTVRPLAQCRASKSDLLLLHITTDSPTLDFAFRSPARLVLIYHNITPPIYMRGLGHQLAERMQTGRARITALRERTTLAIADSNFSEQELRAAGFLHTCVLPVLVPDTLGRFASTTNEIHAGSRRGNGQNLLHVGRVVPNKCIEDVILSFNSYRKIVPAAQLYIVGDTTNGESYALWLRQLVHMLNLDGVHFTGQVSDTQLAAYYRCADTYLCMSEHEGFCVPLVECMRFQVPIIAYAAIAVGETLGDAGVLIDHKDPALVAAMAHLINTNQAVRANLLTRQSTQAELYAPDTVLRQFHAILTPYLGDQMYP